MMAPSTVPTWPSCRPAAICKPCVLWRSPASGSDAKGSSLGRLDSLASARPNQRLVLGGLMQFAGQTDQAWVNHTAGKPEDRLDAGARLRFDTGHMQAELGRLGDSEARQALQQLEGAFGDRARAICDFAVAQVSALPIAKAALRPCWSPA